MRRRSGNKRDFWKDTTQRRMSLFKSHAKLFQRWRWQWCGTLTFADEYQIKFERADTAVKGWLRRLCTGEGIQLACFYALCRKRKDDDHIHVHLLMLGERRKEGQQKTLIDVDIERLKRYWKHSSKIEVIKSQLRASKYLANQFFKNWECKIEFYNLDLLKRKEIKPDLGPCIGAPTVDEV